MAFNSSFLSQNPPAGTTLLPPTKLGAFGKNVQCVIDLFANRLLLIGVLDAHIMCVFEGYDDDS